MSKTLKEYLSLPYAIILRRDKRDEVFVARVEELPGCSAHGDTEQEALSNLRDNMEVWIGDCIDSGDAVPEPTEELGLPSGKWLQRVPRSLHLKLIRLAKQEGVSLNQLVTSALAEVVGGKEIRVELPRSAAFVMPALSVSVLGGCSGVVGNYNVKNEIGLSYYMPVESEGYLTRIQSGSGLPALPNQERRLHADQKKSNLVYQC
jgi:predicted RNase H-like HicB family nuclease